MMYGAGRENIGTWYPHDKTIISVEDGIRSDRKLPTLLISVINADYNFVLFSAKLQ